MKFSIQLIFLTIFCVHFLSCNKNDSHFITISKESIEFSNEGEEITLSIHTNSDTWNASISNDVDWITITPKNGKIGTTTITIQASRNVLQEKRFATIIIKTNDTIEKEITISQAPALYPSYNTNPIEPDMNGMEHSASEIANQITIGWNIGNTLEAIGGETYWGNPMVTEDLIQAVKASGFNAIRIPCSWSQYADSATGKINTVWLERVKQVIQYCTSNDLYVILNIHWDNGWLENNCNADKQQTVIPRQRAYWEQIATYFRNFDEHLLFASANEPNVKDASEMAVLLSYHQTFINTVRSTGGKNAYRILIVQGPNTDIETTCNLMRKMPTDSIANRLMAEVHFYTPFNFTCMTNDESWGKQFYYWGNNNHSTTDVTHNPTWGEEETIDYLFELIHSNFITKGIPVIIGEYGAIRRTTLTGDNLQLHTDSRNYYLNFVTAKAKEYGLKPFYWDSGGNNNLSFGLFNRHTNSIFDQQAINAIMQGISN